MNIVEFIKGLVNASAARLVAYSGAAATAAALFVASKLGVELSAEFLVGVSAFAIVVATEAIRQFVYSQNTTQALVTEAAATGNPEIGSPPKGE